MKLPGNGSHTNLRTFLSFALSYILMWGLIPAIAIADAIRSLYTQERDSGYVVAHSIEDSNELAAHMSETVLASLPADASNVDKLSAAFHSVADVVVISDEAPEDSYEALVSALHGQATTADGATQAVLLITKQMGFESELVYEEGEAFASVRLDDAWVRTNVAASILARMETNADVAEETWFVVDNTPAVEEISEDENAIEVQGEPTQPIVVDEGIIVDDGDDPDVLSAQASTPSNPAQTYNVSEYTFHLDHDSPRCSYLHRNASGDLERVEFIQNINTLVVETLSPSFGVTNQRIIPASAYVPSNLVPGKLKWGGFYSGAEYNFVVTGQSNDNCNDNLVVYRITRFPKDWDSSRAMAAEFTDGKHRIPSEIPIMPNTCYGTSIPFLDGTCVMEELNGVLHVRTSHQMYPESGPMPVRHQASAHLVVNESTMTVTDSMTYSLSRDAKLGYASHSFAQRLAALDGSMYALDLGDYRPRSIAIKKLGVTNGIGDVLQIQGDAANGNNNFTGVLLGGFESSNSAKTLIVTGATMDQAAHKDRANYPKMPGEYAPRNTFVAIVKPSNTISKPTTFKTLTHYAYSGNKGADWTKLVKINDNRFLVVWAEVNCWVDSASWGKTQTGKLAYAFIDGNGNTIGSIREMQGYLSACDPILYGGKVVWYAEDQQGSHKPVYYTIDASEGGTNEKPSTGGNENPGSAESIGNATVAPIANQTYSGQAITPALSVTHKGVTLKQNIDYRVTYANNINVTNDATATVEGVGNYAGTKKVSFKIVAATISSVTPSTTTYTYDGTEKRPGITVKAGSLVVPPGSYDASYKNNKNVGTATITVTGKGNYTGTQTTEFKIVAKGQSQSPSSDTIKFNDVTSATAHFEDIIWMAESGISEGWKNADGTRSFRPYLMVARGDMAAFLFRLAKRWGLVNDSWKASNTRIFTDVSTSTAHSREIWWLAEAGISTGWPDGTFRPTASVARADMAAFLFRLAKKAGKVSNNWKATNTNAFVDVNASTPHSNEIWWLAKTGISTGYPDGTFRPYNTVARADLAAFLHRLDKLS